MSLSEARAAPLLDVAVLDELRELAGDEGFAEIAATFGEQITATVGRLEALSADDGIGSIAHISHELAGVAGTMGALRLSAAAREIMSLCRDERPDEAVACLPELLTIARESLTAFAAYLDAG